MQPSKTIVKVKIVSSEKKRRRLRCRCGLKFSTFERFRRHLVNHYPKTRLERSNTKEQSDASTLQSEKKDMDQSPSTFEAELKYLFAFLNPNQKFEPFSKDKTLSQENWDFKFVNNERDLLPLKNAVQRLAEHKPVFATLSSLQKSMDIYHIFAFFVNYISQFCSPQLLREYVALALLMIKAINETGFNIKTSEGVSAVLDQQEVVKQPLCFSSKHELCALIINPFLAELFPLYFRELNADSSKSFQFLGFEDNQIKNLVLMIKYLGNWFYNWKITSLKLDFNLDM